MFLFCCLEEIAARGGFLLFENVDAKCICFPYMPLTPYRLSLQAKMLKSELQSIQKPVSWGTKFIGAENAS